MGSDLKVARWRRHLEGWQLGLLAVGVALLAAWLGLPRPVEPRLVPLPEVDRRALSRSEALDAERAARVRERPLAYEVRAVGELLRRHGGAAARGDARAAAEARDEARALVRSLAARGSFEELRTLSALQTQLFLDAVERFRERGVRDSELSELGGNFIETGRRAGWVDEAFHLMLPNDAVRVLYRVRWAELTGALAVSQLRPTLDEFRLYYRVLLEHAEGKSERDRDEHRLAYVAALARLDPEFPAEFARGVLFGRLGRASAAYQAFAAFLANHPDGPWVLRARNHALWALAQVPATE